VRFCYRVALRIDSFTRTQRHPNPYTPPHCKLSCHFFYFPFRLVCFFAVAGHKELAIELYRKGIKELEDGIAVDCWSGRGDVWDRAQRLHDKMQTNLSMARDRLHFLGK